MSTETLFDPLRRKEVAATPEEKVRQWFIGRLKEDFAVPVHLMMSEAPLKFGSKSWRADILVYDRQGAPLAVVECKRPDVALSPAVAEQAMRYNIVLGVRWLMLTNGGSTMIFRLLDGKFQPYSEIPDYEQMLCQQ